MVETNLNNIDPEDNLYPSDNSLNSCSYYTVDALKNYNFKDYNCSLINYNIRSYHANFDIFEALLNSIPHNFNLIVLTETWNSIDSSELCLIDGYTGSHTYRQDRRGGGVSIFCRSGLKFEMIESLCKCNSTIETCIIKVKMGGEFIFVVGVYRPHTDTVDNFLAALDEILHHSFLQGKLVLIVGDLNIDLTDLDSTPVNTCMNFLNSFHFLPIITKPTRFSSVDNIAPSALDHIWINMLTPYKSGIIYFDQTDHLPNFFTFSYSFAEEVNDTMHKLSFRPYSEVKYNKLCDVFSKTDWTEVIDFNDPNSAYDNFSSYINRIYCNIFPLQVKFISHKRLKKPWVTSEVMNLIRKKSQIFKMFKTGLISRAANNRFRNNVNKVITGAKREHYLNVFSENRRDIKRSWKLIRDLAGFNVPNTRLTDLLNETGDPSVIVNKFNNFFSSVGYNLDAALGPSFNQNAADNVPINPKSFYFFRVTNSEVSKIISKLKIVKSDLYTMPVRIFKQLRRYFAPPLARIINLSVESGIFPCSLKLARIIPIHKKGDIENPTNYRPISCLPYISKIFEKCMTNRLISFCNKCSIFTKYQFGFRHKLSTSDALINLTENIYDALNNRNHLATYAVDLRKAFDVVNHSIILNKMERMGIRGLPLNWFRNYLTDRRSYVEIGSTKSDLKTFNIGVPQGSTLGPILFLLYINDLPLISDLLNMTLFADDTTLSVSNPHYNELIANSNDELTKFNNWTLTNRLTINTDKTEMLLFSNKFKGAGGNDEILLNGVSIEAVKSFKFLGVYLDDKLSFEYHIKHVINKISRHSGIIYKIRKNLPEKALLDYYYAFIYPYISYNVEVWGAAYAIVLNPLIVQHKRIIRTMTWSHFRDHTSPLFKKLGVLKFMDIYKYRICIRMYKSLSNGEFLVEHDRLTRCSNLAAPKFHRLTLTQHAFSFTGPSMWNSLPDFLRSINSFPQFKSSLRKFLIDQY